MAATVREAGHVLQMAFHPAKLRSMRFRLLSIAFVILAIPLPGRAMSKKPVITVRFHTETNANDGDTFATPVQLEYQRRSAHLSRTADFSEKQIEKIFPVRARDGTWGCVFKLNPQGRIRLESISSQTRGSTLVVFLGTKIGRHQVVDMIIDRPVLDGIIAVPRGITDLEMLALRAEFKVMGEEKKKGPQGPPRAAPDPRSDRLPLARPDAPPTFSSPPPRRGRGAEPDLPRLAD